LRLQPDFERLGVKTLE